MIPSGSFPKQTKQEKKKKNSRHRLKQRITLLYHFCLQIRDHLTIQNDNKFLYNTVTRYAILNFLKYIPGIIQRSSANHFSNTAGDKPRPPPSPRCNKFSQYSFMSRAPSWYPKTIRNERFT